MADGGSSYTGQALRAKFRNLIEMGGWQGGAPAMATTMARAANDGAGAMGTGDVGGGGRGRGASVGSLDEVDQELMGSEKDEIEDRIGDEDRVEDGDGAEDENGIQGGEVEIEMEGKMAAVEGENAGEKTPLEDKEESRRRRRQEISEEEFSMERIGITDYENDDSEDNNNDSVADEAGGMQIQMDVDDGVDHSLNNNDDDNDDLLDAELVGGDGDGDDY